jgi:single-strand DNA-binding protein
MNKVILMGRLTRDPEVRYSQGATPLAIARYTIAVDRRQARGNGGDDQQTADFISCVAFGRSAQFAEQYLRKGVKIAVTGRIQTGRYTNKDGQTVFTTDVVVEDQEFAESKAVSDRTAGQASYSGASYGAGYSSPAPMPQGAPAPAAADDGFINIPDGIDEELPFK